MTFLLFLFPALVVSWWDVGHMLTAAIAEKRLKEISPYSFVHFSSLIFSINNLVDNRSRTFIESSCWPDDIKSKKYHMNIWSSWHFIDKPYVNGTFPQISLKESAVNGVNVIQNAIQVLRANINKSTVERALFARYLIHVTGDLHQPLHSTAFYNRSFQEGDRGGNRIKIFLQNGTKMNLHSFWDSGAMEIQNNSWYMIRPLNQQNLTALKNKANSLVHEFEDQIKQLSEQLDPSAWAIESYQIAKDIVYPHFFKTNEVDSQYAKLAYQTVKKRIVLAGYRIANLIAHIYELGIKEQNTVDKWEKMKHYSQQNSQSKHQTWSASTFSKKIQTHQIKKNKEITFH